MNPSLLKRWPTAAGPGMYSDQASSFLDALADELPRGLENSLAAEQKDSLTRQANPPEPDDDSEVDKSGTIVSTDDLIPIAMMVTGMWGPGIVSSRTSAGGRFGRLPVINNGDADSGAIPGRYEAFWPRMKRLRAALGRLREAAPGRYQNAYSLVAARVVKRIEVAIPRDVEKGKLTKAEARKATEQAVEQLRLIGFDRTGRGGRKVHSDQPWLDAIDRMLHAVDFLIAQEGSPRRSILGGRDQLPFGWPIEKQWGIVAAAGNKKLPFYAYSELPMSTCAGAGTCGVPYHPGPRAKKKGDGQAWCYSFKAWRYPAAFVRQFLNTLAHYADREFAILGAADGQPVTDLSKNYDQRVQAAVRGRTSRKWPALVRDLIAEMSAKDRAAGRVLFLRLFVDGDLGPEDSILAWMDMCRDLGPEGMFHQAGYGHVEVYGYSKQWAQLVEADRVMRPHLTDEQRASPNYRGDRGHWPINYTFNMSSGSVYEGKGEGSPRAKAETLPITRGYFVAINLGTYLAQLEKIRSGKYRIPKIDEVPYAFSEDRIKDFAALNAIGLTPDGTPATELQMLDAAAEVMRRRGGLPPIELRFTLPGARDFIARNNLFFNGKPGGRLDDKRAWDAVAEALQHEVGRGVEVRLLKPTAAIPEPKAPPIEVQIKRQVYIAFLNNLLTDKNFAELVADEVEKDSSRLDEATYLRIAARKSWAKTERELHSKSGKRSSRLEGLSDKVLHDKALALVLHEVLWSAGAGGSCPLICGNCSDLPHPTIATPGRHRCASIGPFRDKQIHIGLH